MDPSIYDVSPSAPSAYPDTMPPHTQPGKRSGYDQPESSNGGYDHSGSFAGSVKSPSQSRSENPQAYTQEGIDKEWKGLKTKAGKERKRLPLACIACRKKKIRCSGEKPACKHCQKSRIPCVYKVTMRKAAPRTDYMVMLDKRLKRMEDRVIKIIPRENGEKPNVTRAVVKPSAPIVTSKNAASRKRSIDEAFNEENKKTMERLSPRPIPAAKPGIPVEVEAEKTEDSLQTEGQEHLPSVELQAHLIEVYFEYVYGQSYHLLHKPSFMRKFQAGTVPPVLMLAVCAISARFSNHPHFPLDEVVSRRGKEWAEPAHAIATKRYDAPNITILITFLILGLHDLGTCDQWRSYMLGGMALRMAYALKLHLDPELTTQDSGEGRASTFIDREIERRTMWSCFIMDRMISSGTKRPMAAGENFLELSLPIKESFFQMEKEGETVDLDGKLMHAGPRTPDAIMRAKSNLGVAAYTIRLIAILGRVFKYLNLGGRDKDDFRLWHKASKWTKYVKQLKDFDEQLPSHMHYSTENLRIQAADNTANQFLYMHIIYNHIICLLHRFAIPGLARAVLPSDAPPDFSHKGRVAAFGAAVKVADLVTEGLNHRLVVPFSGYCAYYAAMIQIYGIISPDRTYRAAAQAAMKKNVKFLKKVSVYWGVYVGLPDMLQESFLSYSDAYKSGALSSGKVLRIKPFYYGDWLDRKYPEESLANLGKQEGADAAMSQKPDLRSVADHMAALSPESRARHPAKMSRKQKSALLEAETRQKLPPPPSSTNSMNTRSGGSQKSTHHLQPNLDHMEMLGSPYGLPESYDRSHIQPQLMPPPGAIGNNPQAAWSAQETLSDVLPPMNEVPPTNSFDDGSAMPNAYNNDDQDNMWNFGLDFGETDFYPDMNFIDGWMNPVTFGQEFVPTPQEQNFCRNDFETFANIPGAYFVQQHPGGDPSNNDNGNMPGSGAPGM